MFNKSKVEKGFKIGYQVTIQVLDNKQIRSMVQIAQKGKGCISERLPYWPRLVVAIKRHKSHLIQTQDDPENQNMLSQLL